MKNLSLEGCHNKFLVAFYGFLKIFDRKMLVVGMGDENIARTVEVPLVVSIQVWYIGTIVDDNSIKPSTVSACKLRGDPMNIHTIHITVNVHRPISYARKLKRKPVIDFLGRLQDSFLRVLGCSRS